MMAAAAMLDFKKFKFLTVETVKKVEVQILSKSFEPRPRYVSFNVMLDWLKMPIHAHFWRFWVFFKYGGGKYFKSK